MTPLDQPQRAWSERYEGPADALARIRVTVSGQRVEQVVVPASACLGIGPPPSEEGP